mmetsp:Transcript_200/g.322  ORF Transcript_200/g.322 Transcript_200/m.322 type:complete len:167 (+) Transcript_200:72-572(+)
MSRMTQYLPLLSILPLFLDSRGVIIRYGDKVRNIRLNKRVNKTGGPSFDDMVKTCENSNSLKKDDIDYTLENLCISVESKLSKEYKDFDDFNKDCISKLGKPCKHECLALAGFFDSISFTSDPKDKKVSYPFEVGNKVRSRKYTLSASDCLRCLTANSCSLDADIL